MEQAALLANVDGGERGAVALPMYSARAEQVRVATGVVQVQWPASRVDPSTPATPLEFAPLSTMDAPGGDPGYADMYMALHGLAVSRTFSVEVWVKLGHLPARAVLVVPSTQLGGGHAECASLLADMPSKLRSTCRRIPYNMMLEHTRTVRVESDTLYYVDPGILPRAAQDHYTIAGNSLNEEQFVTFCEEMCSFPPTAISVAVVAYGAVPVQTEVVVSFVIDHHV
jgi:hypothetical protein